MGFHGTCKKSILIFIFINAKAREVLDAKDANMRENISTLESKIAGITAYVDNGLLKKMRVKVVCAVKYFGQVGRVY